ncbi:MAG: 30S ribosomal protein S16 [Pirellulaceae bacterium]
MAVRIRMKKMGRAHRPFYRLCAVDQRTPRDGKVIEELGYYDTSVPDTDARAILKGDRIAYWLGVGAQASDKCHVLIKKYGENGTHLEKQRAALDRLQKNRPVASPKPMKAEAKPSQEEQAGEEAGQE